jgi:hypothetical protein
MPKAHEHWKVLPHGKLVEVVPNILTVTGTIRMPLDAAAPLTVARLADKRLVLQRDRATKRHGDRGLRKARVPVSRRQAPPGRESGTPLPVHAGRRAVRAPGEVADVVPVDTAGRSSATRR